MPNSTDRSNDSGMTVLPDLEESRRQDGKIDAQALARLARIDPQLLSPIQHRSAEVQADLTVIRARYALVRARTGLICAARGLTKSFGNGSAAGT